MSISHLTPGWLQWGETRALLAAFAAAGAEVRFVGGCVRDALRGFAATKMDIDLATPATPEKVMALLEKAKLRAIPTGIDHGTVTALVQQRSFEVTTLRKDMACDGRHADVEYTDDWKEDAKRRDFTINALYLSADGTLFDYFGAVDHLNRGIVQFIGDAETRIIEDALRILRFFRFHARFGKGAPDAVALAACAKLAPCVRNLSGERVCMEMQKLLIGSAADALQLMKDSGVLFHTLEFEVKDPAVFRRITEIENTVAGSEPDAFHKFAVFALQAKNMDALKALEIVLARLKFSNHEAKQLRALVMHYPNMHAAMNIAEQKKLLRTLGTDIFRWLAMFHWAMENRSYAAMLTLAKEWEPPVFPVKGEDLIALGMAPGKGMGQALAAMEVRWEAADYKPGKEDLLKIYKSG